jgi:hypothetical protein
LLIENKVYCPLHVFTAHVGASAVSPVLEQSTQYSSYSSHKHIPPRDT